LRFCIGGHQGGEAAALKVLKDDLDANGGEWLDMPVTGGGGDAANVALKARIVAGDPPRCISNKRSYNSRV